MKKARKKTEHTIKGYRSSDLGATFSIKRCRYYEWLSRGWIPAGIHKSEGRGLHNVWSREDFYQIALFLFFLDMGFLREDAASFAAMGRRFCGKENKSIRDYKHLYYSMKKKEGKDPYWYMVGEYKNVESSRKEFAKLLDQNQQRDYAILVNLEKIVRDTDRKIRENL
ncbi:MAG: hypothetical protein GY847_01520 [Proteobacteria bacterium]|nr:hypothetical protein [Pseudomonadota bacterium]